MLGPPAQLGLLAHHHSMTTNTSNLTQTIRGNTSLVLGKPATVWRLQEGSLAVFGARLKDGVSHGPRQYLFSCAAGECLFSTAPDDANSLGLVVVALANSQVEEINLSERSLDRLVAFEPVLETWIDKLAGALSTTTPYVEPIDEGSSDLESGQAIKPKPHTLNWLRVSDGKMNVLGLTNCCLESDDGWLPATQHLWLNSETNTSLVCGSAFSLNRSEEWLKGINLLHRQFFAGLATHMKEEADREVQRLYNRDLRAAANAANSLDAIVKALEPGESHHETRETPLLTALAALEPELGIEFTAPAEFNQDGETSLNIVEVAKSSRVRIRNVTLAPDWWQQDCGPLLAYRDDQEHPVALYRVARGIGLFPRYEMFDPATQRQQPVDQKIADSLLLDAVTFIRPLPEKNASSFTRMMRFNLRGHGREALLLLALALFGMVVGMVQPMATKLLIDTAIPQADLQLLLQLFVGLLAMAIGITAFSICQGYLSIRLATRITAQLQAGLLDRLLRLPLSFFRNYSTGDLTNRALMFSEMAEELNGATVTALLSGLMSLVNLVLCYYYSSQLAWLAAVAAATTAVATVAFSLPIRRMALAQERLSGIHEGLSVQLVNGISKLRNSGAEQRAYNVWLKRYANILDLKRKLQRLDDWSAVVNLFLQTGSMVLVIFFGFKSLLMSNMFSGTADGGASVLKATGATLLTMGTFLAFQAAFKSTVDGFVKLCNTVVDVMDSWSKREMVRPLLDSPIEDEESHSAPGTLDGHIKLEDVVFRYHTDAPRILNGVSLECQAGEFVAFVGSSGCGKSTVFRLLLGFDVPESGKIYYDNSDLSSLNKAAVRRQMGIVTQQGNIQAGSIMDVIRGGSELTLEETWDAARDAGLEEDIRGMPMEMHTVVTEGATTFSGGQRQRLHIARALATNPRILLMDEATSALDNRTQAIVQDSLNRRNVTRIVIAHRLSTIRDADRIFVFEKGRVTQTGTFDELLQQPGLFARLAARQMVQQETVDA